MKQKNTSQHHQSDFSRLKPFKLESNNTQRLFIIVISLFSICLAFILSSIVVYNYPQVIFYQFFLSALIISTCLIIVTVIITRYTPKINNLFNNKTLINQIIEYETIIDENQQRFYDFTEIASDWLWELDAALVYTYISERFFSITGFERDQYIGLSQIGFAKSQPHDSEWKDHLETITAHKPFRDFTYSVKLPNGSTRWLRINGNPRFNTEGTFIGYSGKIGRAHV